MSYQKDLTLRHNPNDRYKDISKVNPEYFPQLSAVLPCHRAEIMQKFFYSNLEITCEARPNAFFVSFKILIATSSDKNVSPP